MVDTKEVNTRVGTWLLRKPKAGPRNRAMIKAEISNGDFKVSILAMELMPKMVQRRPDSFDVDVPIEQVLDSLDTDVYDDLQEAAMELIFNRFTEEKAVEKAEEKKKSSSTSSIEVGSQTEDQKDSGS